MDSLKRILKYIYYRFYKPRLYSSFQNYSISDEQLKFIHILEALNYLRVTGENGKVLPQNYFEFGCHSGRTFSAAINAGKFLKMDSLKVYAFDSFEGLPETNEDDGYFQAGTFKTSAAKFKKIVKSKTGVVLKEDQIIKGYYEKSLNDELVEKMPKLGVLHIDVDLYSSTVSVLNFVKPLLSDGSIILFDDFYCFKPTSPSGEKKALIEFLSDNQEISIIPWKAYSTFGQSFFVKIDHSNNV
tara:strand:+ start:151 stop:876 length:726 start_codon:yes stop_codon:yes gene_type:complete